MKSMKKAMPMMAEKSMVAEMAMMKAQKKQHDADHKMAEAAAGSMSKKMSTKKKMK